MRDIDTPVVVDSLKALDPNRPIREADTNASIWLRKLRSLHNTFGYNFPNHLQIE